MAHTPNIPLTLTVGGVHPSLALNESEAPHMRYQVSFKFKSEVDLPPDLAWFETFEEAQKDLARTILDLYFEQSDDEDMLSDVYRILSAPSYPGVPIEVNNPEYRATIAQVPA